MKYLSYIEEFYLLIWAAVISKTTAYCEQNRFSGFFNVSVYDRNMFICKHVALYKQELSEHDC